MLTSKPDLYDYLGAVCFALVSTVPAGLISYFN